MATITCTHRVITTEETANWILNALTGKDEYIQVTDIYTYFSGDIPSVRQEFKKIVQLNRNHIIEISEL